MTNNPLKDSALADLIAAISLNEKSLQLALTRVALCELQQRRKTDNQEPVMYCMKGENMDEEAVSTCKSVVDGWVEEWNHDRSPGMSQYKTMALYAVPQHEQVVPDGYCIMPVTLTSENGAKRALSGEFSIPRSVTCPECGGDGCSDCDGRGDWNEDQIIDWPTIKLIYQKAVEACAITSTQKQDKSV